MFQVDKWGRDNVAMLVKGIMIARPVWRLAGVELSISCRIGLFGGPAGMWCSGTVLQRPHPHSYM